MANRMILNETSWFGSGSIKKLPEELKKRGIERVLVVTDAGLVKAKIAAKITSLLVSNRIVYQIFDKVKSNPTIQNVKSAVETASQFRADAIVAVGGGSVIDTAKAVSIICTNPEFSDVRKLEGASKTAKKGLPLFAVTTTSGTAAEVTINYVITDETRQRKFVCIDPHDIPVVAIVDPDLSSKMPAKLCASCGMDALVHAIEGYLTKDAWQMTDMYCLEAIRIISANIKDAVKGKAAAREQMAYGQYIAGMGFSNCGLGLVHAMAHPLSAVFDVPHGEACAILLSPVLKFNAASSGTKYKDIALAMGAKVGAKATSATYRKTCMNAVDKLLKECGIPKKIDSLGDQTIDYDFLAESALKDACIAGNPKEITRKKVIEIYKSILK
ncbi:MAG: lactaldehyde reductase [Treponema sp.]|nr:lactaldehyde reductase [Treponema sp.]